MLESKFFRLYRLFFFYAQIQTICQNINKTDVYFHSSMFINDFMYILNASWAKLNGPIYFAITSQILKKGKPFGKILENSQIHCILDPSYTYYQMDS